MAARNRRGMLLAVVARKTRWSRMSMSTSSRGPWWWWVVGRSSRRRCRSPGSGTGRSSLAGGGGGGAGARAGLGRGNDQEHPDFQSGNRLGAVTVTQKVSLAWEGLGAPSTGRIVPPRRLKFFDGGVRDGDSETRSAGTSTGQHARGSCAMMLVLLCLVDIWRNTYFSAIRSIEVSS